jgi:hypothetical protein
MNIYLITAKDYIKYDEYDAVVLIAENRSKALILANTLEGITNNSDIKKIGETTKINSEQIVLGSFNAG